MRSYKKELTKKGGARCDYDSAPNDIGPENEGDEGYLSPDSDEGCLHQPASRYDKPDDAIPAQGLFLMRARHRLACVDVVAPANRVKAISTFFSFILKPAYAPFHRFYSEWRVSVHKKCDEFLAETTDATLRALCERFKMEFPVG
jgi:hypothetical protein